jgi:hypothetical protein
MNGGKPANASNSITPIIGERLADTRKGVNGLQTGITKAAIKRKLLPDTERVAKCLSGVRRKFHAPFLKGLGPVTAPGYLTVLKCGV